MRIGTRSSKMAMAQTRHVVDLLRSACAGLEPRIVESSPLGDRDQISKLDRHGGKGGAFVEEIRTAMREGALQAAMHSLKDMPGDEEAPGLVIGAALKRDCAEDALVLRKGLSIEAFFKSKAAGMKIGTNSVRRAAYLRRLFPEALVIHYRGAADTRIRKLEGGVMQGLPDGGEVGPADALVMAQSGLLRVGAEDRISHVFSHAEMLPAVGQGIVAVECCADDWETRALLAKVGHAPTRLRMDAEREVLWVLNGHCNTPIAAHAKLDGDIMMLKAAVMSEDGATFLEVSENGPCDRPRELGRSVGLSLLQQGAAKLIDDTR
ncbi:MAG: hydroxymethylbilane synthase [Marinicaulis sp.]|nr:hydroxymethylbilane synthase [Marinicaulis sp.]